MSNTEATETSQPVQEQAQEQVQDPQARMHALLMEEASKMTALDANVLLLQQHMALLQFTKQIEVHGKTITDLSHAVIRLEGHAYSVIKLLLRDGVIRWEDVLSASLELAEPGVPLHQFFGLKPEQYTGTPADAAQTEVPEEAPAQ